MSKFCLSCFTEVEDDASVCPQCGYNFDEGEVVSEVKTFEETEGEVAEVESNNIFKKYMPVIVSAAAIVIITVLIVIISSAANAYKKPLKYMEQTLNGNFKNYEKLAPAEYWEYYKDIYGDDIKDIIKEAEESYEEYTLEDLEEDYGRNIKINIKDVEKRMVVADNDLEEIRDGLRENYGIPNKSVKKAIKIGYVGIIKGDKDMEIYDSNMIVAKINGRWYPVSSSGSLVGV